MKDKEAQKQAQDAPKEEREIGECRDAIAAAITLLKMCPMAPVWHFIATIISIRSLRMRESAVYDQMLVDKFNHIEEERKCKRREE